MADHRLRRAHRRVTAPSTWGGVVGALLGTAYAYVTLEMPQGRTWHFLGLVSGALVLASVLGDRSEQGRLKTLKAIGDGTQPPSAEGLQRALSEVAAIPDVSFFVNLIYWSASTVALALAWAALPGVPWSSVGRVLMVGLSLGPLVATLAHVLVLRRARQYQREVVACGLSPEQALAAVPARTFHLKRRLMIFIAVAIVTPLALIADMGNHRTEQTLDRLEQLEAPAARQALLDTERDTGLAALLVVALLAVTLVVACGYLGGAALSEPMAELAAETRRIAEGRLGRPQVTPAEDEEWAAASALVTLELQLLGVVRQLRDAGDRIGVSAADVGLSSDQHEAGAREQTAALTATSATTEELARSARQIAANATEVSSLATQTLEAARSGKRSADAFYASILTVRGGNQAIADSVVKLNKRVQQVGRVVEFIDGVADRSDLLAVNAELEGNKAGEVGRGFSLVAAEMRRLSESVMRSTREIRGLIDEIRDATNAAVMATEAGVKATDVGSALASQVSESLGSILDNANQTSDAIKSITLATHQQQSSTDQLADAMNDILRSTQASGGESRQMGRANLDLRALAEELKRAVGRFEVDAR